MKKPSDPSYPPKRSSSFGCALSRWIAAIPVEDHETHAWAERIVADGPLLRVLNELVHRYRVAAADLLQFQQELRTDYAGARDARASLRKKGSKWKQVEMLAGQARRQSEPHLGNLREGAYEIEKTARLLSKYFIEPTPHRPFEAEISAAKQAIVSFLRRHGVREVNGYGWIVLRAVFENGWKAGKGKDQIEAFRQIPVPFRGSIKRRKDAQLLMDTGKLQVFMMEDVFKRESETT